MRLEVLHAPQQAANAVRRVLGLNASCPSSEGRFEILRATVWSMAAPSSKAHVNRVLGAALQLLDAARPAGADEQRALAALEASVATQPPLGDATDPESLKAFIPTDEIEVPAPSTGFQLPRAVDHYARVERDIHE